MQIDLSGLRALARGSTKDIGRAVAAEVAEVVAFLYSREASAVTGAPVRADGGVVMAIT